MKSKDIINSVILIVLIAVGFVVYRVAHFVFSVSTYSHDKPVSLAAVNAELQQFDSLKANNPLLQSHDAANVSDTKAAHNSNAEQENLEMSRLVEGFAKNNQYEEALSQYQNMIGDSTALGVLASMYLLAQTPDFKHSESSHVLLNQLLDNMERNPDSVVASLSKYTENLGEAHPQEYLNLLHMMIDIGIKDANNKDAVKTIVARQSQKFSNSESQSIPFRMLYQADKSNQWQEEIKNLYLQSYPNTDFSIITGKKDK